MLEVMDGIFGVMGPYRELVYSLAILIAFVILAKVVSFGTRRYIMSLASKTKTDLDDMVVKAVGRPIFLLVVLAGLYFAAKEAPTYVPFQGMIDPAFSILSILVVALATARVFNVVIGWYAMHRAKRKDKEVSQQFLSVTQKIIYVIVLAIALVWMLGQLGIEITALVASLGIGGLAIALALQPTLSNFFAGAYMIMDKPIRVGDYVELDSGEKGFVEDISWRTTRLKVLGNNMLIIPNSKLAEAKIINYYYPTKEMSVVVKCGVGYGSDLEKVEKVTVQVAKEVIRKNKGAVKGFEPFVRFNEFGDSNINFSIILRVNKYVDKYLLTHEFIKALKKRYDREKIEISWPVRKIHMAK
jgi:small-conductance mechanosensitive channel